MFPSTPGPSPQPRAFPPLARFAIAGVPLRFGWSTAFIGTFGVWLLASGAVPVALPRATATTAWLVALAVVVGHVLSVTVQQVAEALIARRHGLSVRDVTVALLGGRVHLERPPTTWRAELGTAAAGPVTAALLAGAFGVAAVVATGLDAGPTATALSWVAFANIAVATLGLLPARPFPGGRILTAALWARRRDHLRAVLSAAVATRIVAMLLIAGGVFLLAGGVVLGIWAAVIGWLTIGTAAVERRAVQSRLALAGVPAGVLARRDLPSVQDFSSVEQALAGPLTAHPTAGAFVVQGFGGPVGILLPAAAAAVPAPTRADQRVASVMLPLRALPVVRHDVDAGVLLTRLPAAVVQVHDADGRFAGVLLAKDLLNAAKARIPMVPRHGWVPPDPALRVG